MPRPGRDHPADVLRAAAGEGRAEPQLVAALSAAVSSSGPATVGIDTLRAAALAADASMAEGSRRRLHRALAALVADGTVRVPRDPRSWDAGVRPALPHRVVRTAQPRPARSDRPGVPEAVLAHLPAGSVDRLSGLEPPLTGAEAGVLADVGRWLDGGGARRPVVPARERSLQVFGHEKRLDALRRGRLFARGLLDLDLLRAEDVPVPFAVTWVAGRGTGVAPVCVVAENHHTWVSLLRAARAGAADHGGVHVGYGAGNQFATGLAAVTLLRPEVSGVAYFGDLDPEGLRIAIRAAAAARAAGLPPVRPALGLYRRLVRSGVRRPAKPVDGPTARELAGWLGPELAAAAVELLHLGVRLPQEAVGTEALAGSSPADWL